MSSTSVKRVSTNSSNARSATSAVKNPGTKFMKTSSKAIGFILLVCSTALLQAQSVSGQPGQAALPALTPYTVVSKDANSSVWQRTTYETSPSGEITANNHSFTELASGLNHLVNGQWVESSEQIVILPNGTAAATNGQHQAYFPGDIYNGEIELITPDGKQLYSQPLTLTYFDGTNTVAIAGLTNSIGIVAGDNQVIYPNAFTGINADLRYTYAKAGFEQDVILHQQPPTPESYGLNADTARLQLMTEFVSPPPTVQASTLPAQAGLALMDQSLNFGAMRMGSGRAFMLGQNAQNATAMVAKRWVKVQGRQILIEEVPVNAIVPGLAALPLAMAPAGKPMPVAWQQFELPPRRMVKNSPNAKMMLSKAAGLVQGFVLDYQTINTSLANYTFQGGTTYYISGQVNLCGISTFDGGAVLKYTNNSSLNFSYPAQVVCVGSDYQPVIFTAMDDNTVGDTITGSTGNPTGYYANPALNFSANFGAVYNYSLTNFYIAWARTAVNSFLGKGYFFNGQLANCQIGFKWQYDTAYLRNMLFANVQTNFNLQWAGADVQNATISGSAYLAASGYSSGVELTNCILANVTNLTDSYLTSVSGSYNGFYKSPPLGTSTNGSSIDPFETAGNDGYYLTDDCGFFDAGTTNIDPALLADLQQMTTYAPQAGGYLDTNTPDLGYHHSVNEDSDFDGLPDWWKWKYFGTFSVSGIDLDGQGNTILYDFTNNIAPNDVGRVPILLSTIAVTDPVDLKWAGTNLYVLSGSTATITEYDADGNIVRSLSGIGDSPSGLDVDADGNVYVAMTGDNQVRKFYPTIPVQSDIVFRWSMAEEDVESGYSFAVDESFGNGGYIGLNSGLSGTDTNAFNAPFDVAVSPDGGTISVSDSGNNRIQQFSANGVFAASFGSYGSAAGQFNAPKGLAYDSVGNLYIADSGNNRIVLANDSVVLGVSGTNGTAFGQFNAPANVSVNDRGIYIADIGNNRIQTFSPLGNDVYSFGTSDFRFAYTTNFSRLSSVAAVDNLTNEMFYVADPGNNQVLLYQIPTDDPTPAWTNMTTHIAAGDIAGAVSSFCSDTATNYEQAFISIGTSDLASDISEMGTLTPVFIRNDAAEYYFEKDIEGHTILFPVEFMKENGVWKIISF
jgi:hypothetical protein